jgi:hypothetical protein
MKKLSVMLALAVCLCMVPVGLVHADNPITVGDPLWYEFGFGTAPTFAFTGAGTVPSSGGNSQYAPDPAWTYNVGFGTRITIVDAFLEGDVFTLYDFGVPIGSTTLVANTGFASGTSDPEVALLDFDLSRGFFNLTPGAHSLTIQVVQNALGASGGAAFFRVDECRPIPLPPTVYLLGTSLLGLAGLRLRRKN